MSTIPLLRPYIAPRQRKRDVLGKMLLPFLYALAAHSPTGLTDEELAGICGQQQTHARGRRNELARMGLAACSNLRRQTSTGRQAIIWQATSAGIAKAKQLFAHNQETNHE